MRVDLKISTLGVSKGDNMTAGAIVMMVFGLCVTWGGALVCLRLALKRKDV